MIGVANAGYRAIAIDFRGYGLSDMPPEPEQNTFMDLLDDIIALLDKLVITKVSFKEPFFSVLYKLIVDTSTIYSLLLFCDKYRCYSY